MQQSFEAILKIFSLSIFRYFLIAGIPFLLCYHLFGERLIRSKIQKRYAARKDLTREIIHSLKTTVIFTAILYIALYTPFSHMTRIYTQLSDYPLWWIFASVILSLIIHDTYFYWMHRILHHPPIFRYVHLVHHQSTNPSPWASYSFDLAEACTEGAVLFVIVTVMPMHLLSIALFVLVAFMINVYGHLGYEVAPLWLRRTLLFEIVNTSVHHNLHHSKFKGNYGLYFRVWDRLMGTEHPDYVKEYDLIQENRMKIN
jgi:sterol desaturase/sphingolipid hydroxylase (fatty acid hydroxylase superfamily)